jgi:hypothetical protein
MDRLVETSDILWGSVIKLSRLGWSEEEITDALNFGVPNTQVLWSFLREFYHEVRDTEGLV